MTGKTVVVTGPTIGGIGFETAKTLATFGARVILGARNTTSAADAVAAIHAAAPSSSVELLQCDLADLDSVQAFAEGLAPLAPQGVDVLVCNAGATAKEAQKTSEGVEMSFAICALGHHKLVHLVRPKRLVWVSGDIYVLAHGGADPYTDVSGEPAYFKACLARMLLAREWKKRTAQEEHTMEVVTVHPGVINTEFSRLTGFAKKIAATLLLSAEQGAQASILAASAPSADIHQNLALPYYHNKEKWLVLRDDDVAMDEEASRKLFETCSEICGIPVKQ